MSHEHESDEELARKLQEEWDQEEQKVRLDREREDAIAAMQLDMEEKQSRPPPSPQSPPSFVHSSQSPRECPSSRRNEHRISRNSENEHSSALSVESLDDDAEFEAIMSDDDDADHWSLSGGMALDLFQRFLQSNLVRPPDSPKGVSASLISQLPCTTVTDESSKYLLDECQICLDTYIIGSNIRTLPCFHCFHSECVGRWLERKDSCPHCSSKVTEAMFSGR